MQMPDIAGKLTPLGNVSVSVDRESETVTLRMKPRSGLSLRHELTTDGDVVSIEFHQRKPLPKLHDEITVGDVNKTTIEVTGVTLDPDGSVWVTGDNGEKYRWE